MAILVSVGQTFHFFFNVLIFFRIFISFSSSAFQPFANCSILFSPLQCALMVLWSACEYVKWSTIKHCCCTKFIATSTTATISWAKIYQLDLMFARRKRHSSLMEKQTGKKQHSKYFPREIVVANDLHWFLVWSDISLPGWRLHFA